MDALPSSMAAIDAAEAAHRQALYRLELAERGVQRASPERAFCARLRYLRCRIIVARSACAVALAYQGA